MNSVDRPSLLYFWDRRTLYLGPYPDPVRRRQGAASLTVSLGDPIKFRASKDYPTLYTRSLLIPAGATYEFDLGSAPVANCLLDPFGEDHAALLLEMTKRVKSDQQIGFDIKNECNYVEGFKDLYAKQFDSTTAYSLVDQLITPRGRLQRAAHPIDPRVERVVAMIKQNINENISIESLAEEVNLSVSRLVEIFKAQIGVPIRRYRLWHRLYVTSVLTVKLGNLTEAAISAGFTDASHFTHTFHAMLGMKPSVILSQPNRTKIFIEQNIPETAEAYRVSFPP